MKIKTSKYDKRMSLLVRAAANYHCQRCHKDYRGITTGGLEHSHIIGRRKLATRWSGTPQNGLSLCTGCHMHMHQNPKEHEALAIKILGVEQHADLLLKSNTTRKWTQDELDLMYWRMAQELKRMQALRDNGETGRIEFIT